jgi:hypothetical protein
VTAPASAALDAVLDVLLEAVLDWALDASLDWALEVETTGVSPVIDAVVGTPLVSPGDSCVSPSDALSSEQLSVSSAPSPPITQLRIRRSTARTITPQVAGVCLADAERRKRGLALQNSPPMFDPLEPHAVVSRYAVQLQHRTG